MKIKLLLIAVTCVVSLSSMAQDETRKKHFNINKNSIAIQGYDPVAYFKSNKAIKGKKDISVTYQGIIYNFSTSENKDLFTKNPTAYEPQYGGWCAYAMGNDGDKVSIDPETFKIINGKLYLFYNSFFNNTLTSWNKDESHLKSKADVNWQKTFH